MIDWYSLISGFIAIGVGLFCATICIGEINKGMSERLYREGYNDYPFKASSFIQGVFVHDETIESYYRGWNKAKMEHECNNSS